MNCVGTLAVDIPGQLAGWPHTLIRSQSSGAVH